MSSLLIKITAPLIYVAFILPVFICHIIFLSLLEGSIGLSNIVLKGLPEALILIILVGSIGFSLANKLIFKIEKLIKPKTIDHFRQSVLFYLGSVYYSYDLIKYGFHGGLRESYVLIILLLSIWAIIINIYYLFRLHDINRTS